MTLRNRCIQAYRWDGLPRARTILSLLVLTPVIAMSLLMAMSLEGPLRYGPYLLCLVAISAVIARPCNRPTVVAIAGPTAMSLIGMMFVAITLPLYVAFASVASICRRIFGAPYGRSVWPDFPPGHLRQAAVAAAVACGIACVWILVLNLR